MAFLSRTSVLRSVQRNAASRVS
ncbi:hypothetical protein TYRP_012780 [Tyrophagus putrescentiae]|nr:hypothetical protein TYRP_012780 [Tyrophagus putrescentiae]